MSTHQAIRKPTGLQWIALSLLVVSVAINYADRGNLGVAARSIQIDLRFSPDNLGMLSTGFFWTYSFGQLLAGKIIDRWNVNWAYAIGFLLWSAATGITGLVNSFFLIFLFRLLLGAGEAIAYPAYSKIIATSFPEQLRGTANALIDAGSKVGPALGVMLGVFVMNRFTWRGMFILIGAASLVWLVPWCVVAAKLPSKRLETASAWAPSYSQLAHKRRFWGTVIGLFGGNYAWYFFLTWLPYYFETERHFTKDKLAILGSLPFWAVAIASMLFGLIADAMIRRGRDAGRVRQTFVTTGLIGCCVLMFPAVLVKDPYLSMVLLVLSAISMAGFSSNHWALTQRLSGVSAAGKWTGFQNCIGNFSGVAGAWITGKILVWTHSFFFAFVIACVVVFIGALGYSLVIGKPDEVLWHPDLTATTSGETPDDAPPQPGYEYQPLPPAS